MTVIECATIGYAPNSGSLIVARGEQTGKIGYRPMDDEDEDVADPLGDPIYSEQVVTLPEPMTPTEFDEYLPNHLGIASEEPVTAAVLEVAEEKDVDTTGWEWTDEDGEVAR